MGRLASKCGFSLVELAVVLVIISAIAGASIGLGGAQQKVARIKASNAVMEVIDTALKTYHLKNGRYPCPAVLTQASTHASYGLEATGCDSACPAGLICNGASIQGFVPFKTIGLSEAAAYDAWGGRIRYVVDNTHVVSSTYANGTLAIQDANGNEITNSTVLGKAIYILLSHGSDRKGAYNKAGALMAACGAAALDSENCDGDAILTSTTVTEIQDINAASYFQDFVSWKAQSAIDYASLISVSTTYNPVNSIFVTGDGSTCVIEESGKLFCAGANNYGRLGVGLTSGALPNSLTFMDNASAPSNWIYIDGAYDHSCGIIAGGDAYCWGYNDDGQLGAGFYSTEELSPTLVTGGYKWKMISGSYFTAGVTQDGRAFAWGQNCYRRTGTNLADCWSTDTPRELLSESGTYPGHTDWEYVSVAATYGCGLRKISATSSKLYCWGSDNPHGASNSGQLGNNNPGGHDVLLYPTAVVTPFEDWYWVGTKSGHSCALRDRGTNGGKLYCWGENGWGYLGDGTSTNRHVPTEVANDSGTYPGFDDWVYVSMGAHNTCGIRSNGDAYCWGWDMRKNTANGLAPNGNKLYPRKVAGGHKWVSISTNGDYLSSACGVTDVGDLYCWLRNDTGAWGNGTNVPNDMVWGYPLSPVLNSVIPFKVKHVN